MKLVGEDFVHRVNQIGLMLKTIMERGVAANDQMQQPAMQQPQRMAV